MNNLLLDMWWPYDIATPAKDNDTAEQHLLYVRRLPYHNI